MNNERRHPNGEMGSVEYLCWSILLACFFYWLDATLFPQQKTIAQLPTHMECPDIQIRHYVDSDLKTGVNVVDACSSHLNPWRAK